MAEEGFNEVFAEVVPGWVCRRIVRVERVPGVAIVDHMGKFLEVAEADSDGMGWKDGFVCSDHVFHALLLATKVLSAGLGFAVRAVEVCFDVFDVGWGHKGVSVFKEGKDSDGVG